MADSCLYGETVKYVYCVASDVGSIDGLPLGLGSLEVRQVSFGGITALVSDIDPDHLVGSGQNVLIHQEVVQAALRLSPAVVPCRFGTLLTDEKKILSFLEAHSTSLETGLARVRGKVEVSVEAIFEIDTMALGQGEGGGESGAAGEKYLLAKRERYKIARALREQAERLGRELNEATAPLWKEAKAHRRPLPSLRSRTADEGLLLSLCYLVDRDKVPAFHRAYQQFKRRWPTVKFLYTGPWPSYSFAELKFRK